MIENIPLSRVLQMPAWHKENYTPLTLCAGILLGTSGFPLTGNQWCGAVMFRPYFPEEDVAQTVIKWRPSSALLALCAGNSTVTGEIPLQRPVTLSFDVIIDLYLYRFSKQSGRRCFETPFYSLWCYCNAWIKCLMIENIPLSRVLQMPAWHKENYTPLTLCAGILLGTSGFPLTENQWCGAVMFRPYFPEEDIAQTVIKWRPSSALLALCAGNSTVTGEIPLQRPVTLSFDVIIDLYLYRLSKQSRRQCFETPFYPL